MKTNNNELLTLVMPFGLFAPFLLLMENKMLNNANNGLIIITIAKSLELIQKYLNILVIIKKSFRRIALDWIIN